MENHCCSIYYLAFAVCKKGIGRQTQLLPCAKIFFFSLVDRLCPEGFYVLTEQMCIVFAAWFILRGYDMHIDLPSVARAFSLTSFKAFAAK